MRLTLFLVAGRSPFFRHPPVGAANHSDGRPADLAWNQRPRTAFEFRVQCRRFVGGRDAMPLVLFWAANAVIRSSGYYLMAVAAVMDGAVALAAPVTAAERRRSEFRVIQGGKL